MELSEIINRVDQAISMLLANESDALERRINETNLTAHLNNYLQPLFLEYNVDPEYNGDIDKPNDRKALHIAESRMKAIGFKVKKKNSYSLSPDIIIHRRGTNEHNLIVIEVKKDISSENHKAYDHIKLEHLTIDYLGNHYNYRLGMAITFGTGQNTGQVNTLYFRNGISYPSEADLFL